MIDELPPGPPPEGYLDYLRDSLPDETTVSRTITPPNSRRNDRSRRRASRQLRLPLDLGAGPENDVFS